MAIAALDPKTIADALSAVMRHDRGRIIALLVARFRDFQLAEEALQDAGLSALQHWGRSGLPHSPQAWLVKVAERKALDRLRSNGRSARRDAIALQLANMRPPETLDDIPDERLRLIFTCCHPALEEKTRVALTLRTVCGLTTDEIARGFLDETAAMGQRLSRAKAKIAAAGIPFVIPPPEEWDSRLQTVLTTLYLIFTTGYNGPAAEPRDLCAEAIYLCRLLESLLPGQAEVEGALALMLLTDARREARIGPDGASVPPGSQDQSLWDHGKHRQGETLLMSALARRRAGPFQIKASISACQMAASGPDWPQILQLYSVLLTMEPTPVVRLNHAVALFENGLTEIALVTMADLESDLTGFQPFHAASASLNARAGQFEAARFHADIAIKNAGTEADILLLYKLLAPMLPDLSASGTH